LSPNTGTNLPWSQSYNFWIYNYVVVGYLDRFFKTH
jgi:hypothetical protein